MKFRLATNRMIPAKKAAKANVMKERLINKSPANAVAQATYIMDS